MDAKARPSCANASSPATPETRRRNDPRTTQTSQPMMRETSDVPPSCVPNPRCAPDCWISSAFPAAAAAAASTSQI
jgi:hypothetical protein